MYKISGFADEISPATDIQFEVLNKLGIKYFEPRGIDGKNISDLTDDEARLLRRKMDKAGISVSSIGSPIGKIQITDDFAPHMEKLAQTIRTAKILGSAYIRMFSFYIPDGRYDEYRGEVMDRMKKMTELAGKEGIMLLHENEKGIYGDIPERCKDILETINSPCLRAVFDMANFVQCGAETYPHAFEMLKPYIEYMHIKDAISGSGRVVPSGMGDGHIREIVSELKKDGYKGFYSLEPHLGSFEGLADLELDDTMEKLPEGGEGTFTLAYRSFMNVLEEE